MDENEAILNKLNAYSIRKSLLCISFIDLIFNFLTLFNGSKLDDENNKNIVMYSSLILCFIIFLGIVGINRYRINLVYCYLLYSGFQIIRNILLLTLINDPFYIITIFSLLISCFIFRLTLKFTKYLKLLNNEHIESLQSGWSPTQYRLVLY